MTMAEIRELIQKYSQENFPENNDSQTAEDTEGSGNSYENSQGTSYENKTSQPHHQHEHGHN